MQPPPAELHALLSVCPALTKSGRKALPKVRNNVQLEPLASSLRDNAGPTPSAVERESQVNTSSPSEMR